MVIINRDLLADLCHITSNIKRIITTLAAFLVAHEVVNFSNARFIVYGQACQSEIDFLDDILEHQARREKFCPEGSG